jgi:hypothetical protein
MCCAEGLFPDISNLAVKAKITANATCGDQVTLKIELNNWFFLLPLQLLL